MDTFLTETPLPDMSGTAAWEDYLGHCRKMVDAVSQGWPRGDTDYRPIGSGFLELVEDANATVRGILDLYDKLLAEGLGVPVKPAFRSSLAIGENRSEPNWFYAE